MTQTTLCYFKLFDFVRNVSYGRKTEISFNKLLEGGQTDYSSQSAILLLAKNEMYDWNSYSYNDTILILISWHHVASTMFHRCCLCVSRGFGRGSPTENHKSLYWSLEMLVRTPLSSNCEIR